MCTKLRRSLLVLSSILINVLIVILNLVTVIIPPCLCTGAVNITYEVIRGSLQDLSQVEGALADPGQDFISGTGSVILQDGQTSVAIPVTILEVKVVAVFCCLICLSIELDTCQHELLFSFLCKPYFPEADLFKSGI